MTDIAVKLSCPDTIASSITVSNPSFPDIEPGAIAGSKGIYVIKLRDNCPANIEIPFKLDISSNGHVFWSDNFAIYVYPTGIAEREISIPEKFALHQNYPNPFNPTTTIRYQLPVTSFVELIIYNLNGQKIKTLISEQQSAGNYRFDLNAKDCPSGIYICQLKTEKFTASQRLLLLK